MSRPVIELDGVGKRYRLGENLGGDLREVIAGAASRLRRRPRVEVRDLWSLRDITLTVHEGQALGIIGANGAGKSTLLKIISNITTPTEGTSRTRGRVGSLLEVGTGFHGDLTGLENTYLNGAILGMRRREVARQLDAIVDFAGLSKFMDTPVKRYSSGMYLRLGFAIAAHLAADILLVDEVLAVGDAEFQRRCLGKIGEVEASGRTVLFVSHNLDAMSSLCPEAIWLEKGRLRSAGSTDVLIGEYLRSGSEQAGAAAEPLTTDPTARAQIESVRLVDETGTGRGALGTSDAASIQVDIIVREQVPGLDVCALVSTDRGTNILAEALSDVPTSSGLDIGFPGRYRIRCVMPPVLTPGNFSVDVWLGTNYEDCDMRERVLSFSVEGAQQGRPDRLVKLSLPWEVERIT